MKMHCDDFLKIIRTGIIEKIKPTNIYRELQKIHGYLSPSIGMVYHWSNDIKSEINRNSNINELLQTSSQDNSGLNEDESKMNAETTQEDEEVNKEENAEEQNTSSSSNNNKVN